MCHIYDSVRHVVGFRSTTAVLKVSENYCLCLKTIENSSDIEQQI